MTSRGICAGVGVTLVCSALIGLGAGSACAQSSASPDQWEGRRVVSVRVVDQAGAVFESNPSGLPLQPGQPFSVDAERQSLRQLFRTGRYSDLTAELTEAADGIHLDFVAAPTYFVNKVAVTGLPDHRVCRRRRLPCDFHWEKASANPT